MIRIISIVEAAEAGLGNPGLGTEDDPSIKDRLRECLEETKRLCQGDDTKTP